MAEYTIQILPSALKQLQKIPLKSRKAIINKIENLAIDPRPSGVVKLTDREGYRIRKGDYRVIYTIQDEELIITVIKVAHRKDAY